MYYERTKFYFRALSNYRRNMRKLQEDADKRIEALKDFKDAKRYSEKVEAIERERLEKVKELQSSTFADVSGTLESMKRCVLQRPVITPTPEQETILRMLKMRDHLTLDELEKAGEYFKDCPMGAAVINELYEQNGFIGHRVKTSIIGKNEALAALDGLVDFARVTCTMNRVDNRGNWLKSSRFYSDGQRDVAAFRCDRDFSDEKSMIGFAAGSVDYESFAEAVNNG